MMKWTSGFNDAPHSRGGSRISQGRKHRGGEGGARTYYFQKFFAEIHWFAPISTSSWMSTNLKSKVF